jgi:hypothetical protein
MKAPVLLLLFTAMAPMLGCGRSAYEGSFVVAVGPKPSNHVDSVIGHYTDNVYAEILRSDTFWSRFVEPRLEASADQKKIHAGFTVTGNGGIAGDYRTFECTVRLSFGGEAAFDAVRAAFADYMASTGSGGAFILSMKKKGPTRR